MEETHVLLHIPIIRIHFSCMALMSTIILTCLFIYSDLSCSTIKTTTGLLKTGDMSPFTNHQLNTAGYNTSNKL